MYSFLLFYLILIIRACVCKCVLMCAWICMCMHVHMHRCVLMCAYLHVQMLAFMCMHKHKWTGVCLCVHSYACAPGTYPCAQAYPCPMGPLRTHYYHTDLSLSIMAPILTYILRSSLLTDDFQSVGCCKLVDICGGVSCPWAQETQT